MIGDKSEFIIICVKKFVCNVHLFRSIRSLILNVQNCLDQHN